MKSILAAIGFAFLSSLAVGSQASAQPLATLDRFAQAYADGDVNGASRLAGDLLEYSARDFGLQREEHRLLRMQIADVLAEAGEWASAISVYEGILSEQETQFGDTSLELTPTLSRLRDLERARGGYDAAERYNERAANIVTAALGDEHPWLLPIAEARAEILQERLGSGADDGPDAEAQEQLQSAEADLDGLEGTVAQNAVREEMGSRAPLTETNGDFELVRVFYGTSRARTGRRSALDFYSGRRADRNRGLETGIVTVSVPNDRELGAIPKPSLFRFEFRADPEKHVIVRDVAPFPGLDEFTEQLRRTIILSGRREAFVYVHGFNNDFAGAAERTAQLAVDLELDGAPILYSWPTEGGVLGYFSDTSLVVRPVVQDLEQFLTVVARESGAEKIHVFAHSMGNRYLLEALEGLEREQPSGSDALFEEIVFAAPDVDADDFEARIPGISRLARRMTLYASAVDRALQLSSAIHRGYRRAGDARQPLVFDGIDTVDTTAASQVVVTDLRHEDAFEHAIDDLRALVWFSLEPRRRCILEDQSAAEGVVWVYSIPDPNSCDAAAFKAAIVSVRRLGVESTNTMLNAQIQLSDEANDTANARRWRAVRDIVSSIGVAE